MGSMSDMQMEQDELRRLASDLLLETGHLEECPHGERLSEGNDDLTETYKLANARITQKMIVLPKGVSRSDFTDLIKDENESAGEECYTCEKNRRD